MVIIALDKRKHVNGLVVFKSKKMKSAMMQEIA